MITFVATRAHLAHHRYAANRLPKGMMRIISYDRLFSSRRARTGTWIFSDFDRLDFWALELAGRYARALRSSGARILNDPARVLQRASLLKQLHKAGINDFGAWRPADGEWPDRYPVFVRTAAAHRGVASGLLATESEVRAEIDRLTGLGHALCDLLVVQYHTQEIADAPGAFRKHAAYVVGGRFVPGPIVTDTHWCAKEGVIGIASEDHYLFERRYNDERPDAGLLLDVAKLANIDFGRIDYGIVGGRVQVYEINTNPHIRGVKVHHSQTRLDTVRKGIEELVDALAALDQPANGIARVDDRDLAPADIEALPRPIGPLASALSRLQWSRWLP